MHNLIFTKSLLPLKHQLFISKGCPLERMLGPAGMRPQASRRRSSTREQKRNRIWGKQELMARIPWQRRISLARNASHFTGLR